MIDNINLQYPNWYILLCILLGLIYAISLYYRDHKFSDHSKIYPIIMGLLRFFTVFGISFLLLNPLIKYFDQDTQKPIIVLAEDISKSISFKDKNLQEKSHSALTDISKQLSEKYEVKHLQFGSNVLQSELDSTASNSSDISGLIQYISDNYSSDHIGAIVLSTDGIYNQGINPIYTPSKIAVPIYSIALGDTTQSKDLLLKNVYHNKIAYLGNEFITQIAFQAFNAKGQTTKIEVYKISPQSTRKKVHEQLITISDKAYFETIDIQIKADVAGINQYRIILKSIEDELTYDNNSKDIYVDVLDMKQKILIVAAAPHPDISAIQTIVDENQNYTIDIQHASDKKSIKFASYDLVILHNLPNSSHSLDQIMPELDKRKIPRLFIIGSEVDFNKFNTIQNCIKAKGNINSISEIQAKFNTNFRSFIIDPSLQQIIEKFPPLVNGFGDYELLKGANVLLKQTISNVNTEYPLLAYKDEQGIKTGVLAGEGIWKWKLFEYLENSNNEAVSQLLRKSIQYLTLKNDKRKLRVETSKNIFNENESIIITAQLFNDNYELVNEPEINAIIKDQDGNSYEFVFSRVEDFYRLNANQLPSGNYNLYASTILNGNKLDHKSRFSIKEIQLELYDLTANHDVLQALSEKTNGKVYSLEESSNLAVDLNSNTTIKPLIFQTERSNSLIDYKWILALLIVLLVVEWFVRRFLGTY